MSLRFCKKVVCLDFHIVENVLTLETPLQKASRFNLLFT